MWHDEDDSILRCDIEDRYGLYNLQKYYDAFNTVIKTKHFHPIKELIELEKWDGTPRIDRFLIDILKCEDNDYHREVSRMIFYGGINRLYKPGCKFDYMPIFIGTQGCGKSSVVKWLALNDSYYGDISSIEGKSALENIQGTWICELSELLAMVKTKDVEAMKSFITRTSDRFRESYGRRTKEFPRTCVFIGTTNDYQFLSDKTGNYRLIKLCAVKKNEPLKQSVGGLVDI
jgi:predicted P-loop ATPase